ncbi:jmjC domain-containing histone demethylation protein 1 [Selaginella moellendorffii]|uniref:jmjC domain-containing histone demethylation protein 1 n=1 Tax=Selaginella moellendorffii TaxID=88036 RepID=UPI000D1C975A|nr:jmjC domain-containing histone demethylation protein 1 [Selaginella moellendorffii]|eukprot:XP_024528476.1 jmjC domain-containing histone demethylation protein 1 [Selaginella moellendorffii]
MAQVRRSKRQRVAVDYARLDETGFDDCTRVQYRKLSRAVAKWDDASQGEAEIGSQGGGGGGGGGGGQTLAAAAVPVVEAKDLSHYVHSTGFKNPCVVRAVDDGASALGLRLPETQLTVEDLAKLVGFDRQIETIDVTTQAEGPVYAMEDWVSYFSSPNPKKPLLNVVSLDLANTPLQKMVSAPSLVKELDLVEKAWPRNQSTTIPEVQLYAIMSVEGCFMDFHLDFGGSSVWYHVISGKKTFLMIPPTKGNLMLFEEWSSSDRQASVFFAERASGGQKVELSTGDTLLLPGGWPHCVVTHSDSIVIGGNFLTGYNLGLQLDIWLMEERLKVRQKFRFPFYKQLMWYTATRYLQLLKDDSGKEEVTSWEKEGLPKLVRGLKFWLQSKDGGEVPPDISDPVELLKELENILKVKKSSSDVGLTSPTEGETSVKPEKVENEEEEAEEEQEDDEGEVLYDENRKDDDEDFDVEKDGDATSSDTDEEFDDESEYSEDSDRPRRKPKPYSRGGRKEVKSASVSKLMHGTKPSPVKKASNTKANTTVRERLMKKIGVDPRMPFNPRQQKPRQREESPPPEEEEGDEGDEFDGEEAARI